MASRPVPVSSDALRNVLGRRAATVAIATARVGERVHGMTVTAFTEVSLDPPLVLVCADKTSDTHPVIAAGGVFALNLLASDQALLSNRFASKKDEARRFEGIAWETEATGAPILPGTLAALDCRVVAAHDAGDHVIYIGRIEAIRVAEDREPLLYHRGCYGVFREPG
ncbi:MAG TPA: flavin reductase family protein [Myxococcota bacterium]|nr:flavin reductase family protein [Myxococcota bacterium]